MTVRLTENAIQAAVKRAQTTGKRADLSDEHLPGLRLRFTPSGRKTWVVACRDSLGAFRRFMLGDHPTMGIAQAREAARQMRAAVRKGADPIKDARQMREVGRNARAGINTLGSLLDLYGSQTQTGGKSWPRQHQHMKHVFASHLSTALVALRAADLQASADTHPSKQSAAAATRYLSPVLKWAVRHHHLSAALPLHPPAKVQERERVLSREELGRLLPHLHTAERPYWRAMLFMLLTLARKEEVAGARWGEVDATERTWTIPAASAKNGKAHVIPLSAQASEMLRSLRATDEAGEPIQPDPGALIFTSNAGTRLGNWDKETKALQQASGTEGWTRHDLRRTGATMLGEMGHPPHVIEAALNHATIHSRLARTYNKSPYRTEVGAALQHLADKLASIERGDSNVVSLRQPAA